MSLSSPFALSTAAHAIGFANGVKIGEVTPSSAVLWTQLTADSEAGDRVNDWDTSKPHWTAPGANGSVHFTYWPKETPGAKKQTPRFEVSADDDHCHQITLTGLRPATTYQVVCSGDGIDGTKATFDANFTTAPAAIDEAPLTFKLFVSATPVVGPDRKNKNDNHSNNGFNYEGERLRTFLNAIPGCFVINGARHWQYHSIDHDSGIEEFGCYPASDQHAGGWKQDDKRTEHQFLRVKGGFLSVKIEPTKATVIHHDVDGQPVNTTEINAPAGK